MVGEVVFNTGMVGYTEAMTDPSYAGQLLCFTYPLIGNYGVPEYVKDENQVLVNFESSKIQAKGVIANSVATVPSHFQSQRDLSAWLEDEGICGIQGLDTRELTLLLRNRGVMMGAIARSVQEGKEALEKAAKYSTIDFCSEVSTKERVA